MNFMFKDESSEEDLKEIYSAGRSGPIMDLMRKKIARFDKLNKENMEKYILFMQRKT